MIQSTSLLSLAPPLPPGPSRQPGGGAAFVLPGGADDDLPTLLADDGDGSRRQEDAAGGNGLPIAAATSDPWLIAAIAPPVAPTVAAPNDTSDSSVGTASRAATSPLTVSGSGPVASPFAVDTLQAPLAAAPPADRAEAVASTLRPDRPLLGPAPNGRGEATSIAPPGEAGSRERTSDDARIAPTPATIDAAGLQTPRWSAPMLDTPATSTDAASIPVLASTGGLADAAIYPATTPALSPPIRSTPARSTSGRGAPVPDPIDALPATALATSSLTPLHRREITAVADIVDRAVSLAPLLESPTSPSAIQTSAFTDPAASDGSTPVARSDIPSAPTIPIETSMTTTALPLGWRLQTPAAPTMAAAVARPAAPSIAGAAPDPGRSVTAVPADAGMPATIASDPRIVSIPAAAAVEPPLRAEVLPAAAPIRAIARSPIAAPEARAGAPTMAAASGPPSPMAPALATPDFAAAQPSAIVFGAARYAARSDERRDDPTASIGGAVGGATLATPQAAAAPPGQAPLDVRHERWPTAMIERIEMIRDAVNEADTRIRLVPDALGAIDVDVRRDGDTLHVRFAAEQPQTRALLQDAAPRLAEAAEQRGLRLGQTTVGGDASGTAQQHQQQDRRQPLPSAPLRTPRPTAEAKADADDTRLA